MGCREIRCGGILTGISTSGSDDDEDSLQVPDDDELTCAHWPSGFVRARRSIRADECPCCRSSVELEGDKLAKNGEAAGDD